MDIFIKLDEHGRMVLPSKIRRKYGTEKFIIEDKNEEIVLKPVVSVEKLFGSLPDLDVERLKREHNREVKNEADD